ncbi:MAG: hypothetical protein Q8M17_02505 [Actinomycetota bacterium]|nr:hypothetical protein [Actinomycetota bacterium]
MTGPSSSGSNVDLTRDVQLAKAAVLYADEVELISPGTETIGFLVQMAAAGPEGLLELLGSLDQSTLAYLNGGKEVPAEVVQNFRLVLAMDDDSMDALGSLTGTDVTALKEAAEDARTGLDAASAELQSTAMRMFEDSGASELAVAIEEGLISARSIIPTADSMRSSDLTKAYAECLKTLIADPQCALLMDEMMGSLARAMIDEGVATPSSVATRRSAEALLGGGLLIRLPALDVAPMEELLDLRRDLDVPLTRYRTGVATLSGRLAAGPFDAEAEAAVEHLFGTVVVPALDEIREEMSTHGLVKDVASHWASDARSVALALVGPVIAGGVVHVADLTQAVIALPVLASAGQAVIGAGSDRARQRANTRKREFFYLYELDRRLGDTRGP